ncbi:unnamed protein product [Phytophthora fragariaefolia]|uniref:Unnamed protein product n=1 Tax=Phytophthora fragariaefolia TaxID=1490495 RepID=A0A9W6Y3H2_9STRA|nr:unnamed protein product [Phytophthora fragariaefolia]
MAPDGFLYLEYEEQHEAEAAVAAVTRGAVGRADSITAKAKAAVPPHTITDMYATLALRRGEPTLEVDEDMKDLLLGRHEANRFSQSQQEQAAEEDDLILQSLSQHSFALSQSKKKKKKKKKKRKTADETEPTKKRRKLKDESVDAHELPAKAEEPTEKKAKKPKKARVGRMAIPTE